MSGEIVIGLQARMNSKRLPGKIMRTINGRPMIYWQIQRILKSEKFQNLIVLTTDTPNDDVLCDYLDKNDIQYYRGSENDVFSRFLYVEKIFSSAAVVRLTADCPLFQPMLLDEMINEWEKTNLDYYSNVHPRSFPTGLDIEIIQNGVFSRLSKHRLSNEEREHVTLGIENRFHMYSHGNFNYHLDLSHLRWTVDYLSDFEFVERIFKVNCGQEAIIDLDEILKCQERMIQEINQS